MTLGLFDLAFVGSLAIAAPSGYDTDAQAYITAVEAADGQALETGVRDAINAFVVGCKADGIWAAIKASCIMAGARTLAGALVPLVGVAPTNLNFVSGDYNRKTGPVGDGITKYLNTNRSNNADPQNSKHMSVYATEVDSRVITAGYIGADYTSSGWSAIFKFNSAGSLTFRLNNETGTANNRNNTIGLIGATRPNSSQVIARSAGGNTTLPFASQAPSSNSITVFSSQLATERSTVRLAFYSIGESLDLALLDARVTTLINAFAAAIP